jgi:hypothetical protein
LVPAGILGICSAYRADQVEDQQQRLRQKSARPHLAQIQEALSGSLRLSVEL